MSSDSVEIQLTRDQALVLFELLARSDEANTMPIEHEAERQVLWAVEGQLESVLVEPLKPNYEELVASARMRLTDAAG